jgi:hypothetical protein
MSDWTITLTYRLILDMGGICFGLAAIIDIAMWLGSE